MARSVRAQVTSVSFFKRASGVTDLAQVRYVKAKRPAGSATEEVTHWIATLQYAYADPSTDPKVRGWNPLGFKIVDSSRSLKCWPRAQVQARSRPVRQCQVVTGDLRANNNHRAAL